LKDRVLLDIKCLGEARAYGFVQALSGAVHAGLKSSLNTGGDRAPERHAMR
jgi:hypothetical protein